jgi:E3 ubiquitin-protein ligase RGLG
LNIVFIFSFDDIIEYSLLLALVVLLNIVFIFSLLNIVFIFSFGDVSTKDQSCFPFFPDGRPCQGIQEALQRYTQLCSSVELSGPTNFGPVIRGYY